MGPPFSNTRFRSRHALKVNSFDSQASAYSTHDFATNKNRSDIWNAKDLNQTSRSTDRGDSFGGVHQPAARIAIRLPRLDCSCPESTVWLSLSAMCVLSVDVYTSKRCPRKFIDSQTRADSDTESPINNTLVFC